MLFNSLPFAVFLVAVCLSLRALPARGRPSLLLIASLLFYALWIPAYLLLLLLEIAVNYALLRGMLRSPRPRLWLTTSIVFSLGLLAAFKYAAFAIATAAPLLSWAFGTPPGIPEILLPLGISFYTFQMLGLAIDAYRRDFAPAPGCARYALFIAFFPHFIAGPILRGRDLLPQLERGIHFDAEKTRRGVWLLACGLAKKTIFADFLLAPFVDDVFRFPGVSTAPVHLVAVWSFAFQIYFDFSGYTDMARGMALLVGLELPFNFEEPYLSRNPAEFWRRWHITLSSWLRDYLYIPLGGNRRGAARTYANLMLTMLLGGLWHGAGFRFLVWGGLHGTLLCAHRAFTRGKAASHAALRWRDLPSMLLLFHAVCLLWVFFRAASFADAALYLRTLATGNYAAPWPALQLATVLLCAALHPLERVARERLPDLQRALGGAWGGLLEGFVLGAILALALAVSGSGGEFIYFRF
jgi:D-alanyl-lipoteichoic acid acyltransferase DltB (MBOAT superfamily)